MTDLLALLARLGEVARVTTLREAGATDVALREAARRGDVLRIRRGWYASPAADAEQRRAVLMHGRLACASALARLGVWSGDSKRTHLQVATNAARLDVGARTPAIAVPGVWHPATPERRRRGLRSVEPWRVPIVHWRDDPDPEQALDWIVSPKAALAQAMRCLPRDHAQAAIDSAVAEGLLPREEVATIVAAAPSGRRLIVDDLSERLESGAESLFVRRLIDSGYRVEPQFDFGSHGRYDGVIDECVLFEVDGWRHHSTKERFHSDRHRTLIGQAFGMPVVRPSATDVLEDWPLVEVVVARVVADARRLRPPAGRPFDPDDVAPAGPDWSRRGSDREAR